MRENLSAARAAELLMQKDNITLLCHRRPDGDTVGSAFALYYALKELGKEVRVLCADALPKQYDYLYGDYTPTGLAGGICGDRGCGHRRDAGRPGGKVRPYGGSLH